MEFARLKDPFAPDHLEWRLQRAGKGNNGIWALAIAYVTARAIMDRLDAVVGPGNWRDEYKPGPTGSGLMCGIGIRVGEEWVTKWDGADNSGAGGNKGLSESDSVKGGFSGAFKRAAVKWGVGRYLYDVPEGWAKITANGAHRGRLKREDGGESFQWDPPDLPAWALPSGTGAVASAPARQAPPPRSAPARQAVQAPSAQQAAVAMGDVPSCPKCGSDMYDNRNDKPKPTYPDFKCKKRDCAWKIWLTPKGGDTPSEPERVAAGGVSDDEWEPEDGLGF